MDIADALDHLGRQMELTLPPAERRQATLELLPTAPALTSTPQAFEDVGLLTLRL